MYRRLAVSPVRFIRPITGLYTSVILNPKIQNILLPSLILETPAVSSRSLRSAGFSLCASQALVLQCAFPRTFEDRAVRVYHTVVTLLLAVQHGNLLIVCPS